jgi:hypothetical protein
VTATSKYAEIEDVGYRDFRRRWMQLKSTTWRRVSLQSEAIGERMLLLSLLVTVTVISTGVYLLNTSLLKNFLFFWAKFHSNL